MLHPVGELPALVYWRRRALLVALTLSLLVGGGWLVVAAAGGGGDTDTTAAGTTAAVEPPLLEAVVPSLAAVEVPTVPPTTEAAPAREQTPAPAPPAPVYTEGQACTDEMISVEVRPSPATAAVGSTPTFDLVVTNTSPVGCVRTLDAGLREVVMVDAAGNRVWGSNDCVPETSSDSRGLAPGAAVVFPVVWSGLGSEPTCTAPRVPPAPGSYLVRGRLDTDTGPDAAFTLT